MWNRSTRGILAAIVVAAGDSAPVGEAIALLAESEDEIEAAKQQAAARASGGSGEPAPAAATVSEPATAAVATVPDTAPSTNGASSGGRQPQRSGRCVSQGTQAG